MKHHEARELLSLYMDDQLSKQERLDFEEHINSCPACAEELKQTIAVMDILKNTEVISPPFDIAKAVTKEITNPLNNKKSIKTKLFRFSAIAAAFIGIMVLTIYNNDSPLNLKMGSSTQSAPQYAAKEKLADNSTNDMEQSLRNSGANYSIAEAPQTKKIQAQYDTYMPKEKADVQQKIIKTASLQLSVVKYQEFIDKVAIFLKENGGYIENTNLYKDDQTKKYNAELSVRIPEKKFQQALSFLQKLGDLKNLNIGSQDVSMQYVDTATKIKTYETQIAALQGMLAKAKKVDEMLQVQNELTRIQAEHDSLVSQNQYIDRSASFATISLSIREEVLSKEKILPNQDADVLSKAKAGLILSINNIITEAQNFFIGAVTLLPHLLLALLAILVGISLYKLKDKK